MDTVGYEPTEGEINFLIVNHVPVNQEHITASTSRFAITRSGRASAPMARR